MRYFFYLGLLIFTLGTPGCFRYSLKDVSIPAEVKTIRVQYIENKSTYINPQLSPQLTDRLRQKINNQTRLTQIQGDDAHYDVRGYISGYTFTTAGISDNRSATNRLTVTVHIAVQNRLDEKKNIEADVSRSFDFDANISIPQAEAQLSETILKNLSDEIFNRIFSNW